MNSNNKIPILIIAPFFAPQTHAAMFRVHKLVKYLPQYGYKPIVVTTDINYNYNEDLSLLGEFSENVEIHRVRYVEPTLRGLRMALGGKDRTFKTMKKNMRISSAKESDNSKINKPNFLKRLKSKIQHFLLNMPDAYWTWVNPTIKKSNELIKEYNIKIFYTTANPNSVLQIGLKLKEQNDIKWISDYRDPIGYIDRYKSPNKYFRCYDKKIIQKAMDNADFITGLANSYEEIFMDLYKIKKEKFKFIPTGLDDQYIPKVQDQHEDEYMLFSGEFLIEYGQYFFSVFDTILKNKDLKKLKIYFIGRREINEPMVMNILKEFPNIKPNVKFIDHIPQLHLYKLIQGSKACLLAAGFDSRWYCNYAKMVDYIALKKPVISVVPKKSEARYELDKSGIGIHLIGDKEKDILLLKDFFNNKVEVNPTNHCEQYLASSQVEEFVTIFNKHIKENYE